MGRFFYRPIQSQPAGWDEFTGKLAQGVLSGVENYYAGKDHQAEQARAAEERARQREREDVEDAWRLEQHDMALADKGGGRGALPGRTSSLDFESTPAPASGIGMGGQRRPTQLGPWGQPDVAMEPTAPDDRFHRDMETPDLEHFMRVGDGDAYIERPEVRTRRQAAEKDELAIGPAARALMQAHPELSEAQARDQARAFGGSVDYDDLHPLPKRWEPTTEEEAIDFFDEQESSRARHREPPSRSDSGLPTIDQAMDQVRQMYAIRSSDGYITGSELGPDEMYALAKKMAAGEDVVLPGKGGHRAAAGGSAGKPFARWTEPPAPGAGRPAQPDDDGLDLLDEAPMGDDIDPGERDTIRARLRGFSPEDQEAALRDAGASPEQIARILGTR